MTKGRMRLLLFLVILLVGALPLMAAFYFMDDALRTSLNLGFNPQIARTLENSAGNLKTLKTLDAANESRYREEFDEIQSLQQVYSHSGWLKSGVLRSLKIYFGVGLVASVLVSVLLAILLSRRISESYRVTFDELTAQRERVRYLEEMSSWQEMARMLAHEIKNPLTPIEVLVTSLARAYRSKSPEEFQEQLAHTQLMVEEELGHLKRTVSRFSDFARIPRVQLTEADPVQVITQHLPAISATYPAAELRLKTDDFPTNARAKMDHSLFRQVLMNIVANGVEANPARTVLFEIRMGGSDDRLTIAISNDGVAVSPALAARIFDPYVSSKAGKDNMGMGLAIVKKIVIEHGGDIEYTEHEGHPRFTIFLPRASKS